MNQLQFSPKNTCMKKYCLIILSLFVLGCSTSDSPSPTPTPEPTPSKKPVASNDSYQGTEDEELVLSGFLNNDVLENNARLSVFDTETSENGVVVDNRNGSFTYTPDEDFVGDDTFNYTICDSDDNCATATITINVQDAGNPQANDDEVNVVIGQALVMSDLVINDDIVDEAVLTSIDAGASIGSVVLNADGTISYSPKAGFSGEDSFTYTLCDDDGPQNTCSTATVTINVLEPIALNIPEDLKSYYSNLMLTTSKELNYEFLEDHTVAKHTTILEYFQRHDYLYEADEDPSNPDNVILMYTSESRYWEEYQSPSNSYDPQTFNTEHIFPQSRLESEGAVTDLHHLRSADASINSQRLNYAFTDGSGTYGLVGGDLWFPGDEWKGDVARMVLYLNVRYQEDITKVGSLELFLKWNIEDPVSEFELQRQEVIEGAQGNRNPFVDNPYLATLIWGGADAENTWE